MGRSKDIVEPASRLVEARDGSDRELAALLKSSLDLPTLSDGRRALVKRRLMYGMRRRTSARPLRRVAVMVAATLLLVAGVARARLMAWVHAWVGDEPRLDEPLPASQAAHAPRQARRASAQVTARPDPPRVEPPAAPQVQELSRDRAPAARVHHAQKPLRRPNPAGLAPAPHAAADAVTPPPPEAAALLGEAWRRLRKDRDPEGALAWLERQEATLAHGPLRSEAFIARLEALLALGDRTRATRELENSDLTAKDPRLLVLRAELYLARHVPKLALTDFERVTSTCRDVETCARALYGQGQAWAAQGETARARDAFERLKSKYPHSEPARLVSHPPPSVPGLGR
ncbi:MAG: tetratricopeptide repeat protein [Myxococcales bacterium]|nr:tetratricopeptide repeat protein [Myxococcales bacterium]